MDLSGSSRSKQNGFESAVLAQCYNLKTKSIRRKSTRSAANAAEVGAPASCTAPLPRAPPSARGSETERPLRPRQVCAHHHAQGDHRCRHAAARVLPDGAWRSAQHHISIARTREEEIRVRGGECQTNATHTRSLSLARSLARQTGHTHTLSLARQTGHTLSLSLDRRATHTLFLLPRVCASQKPQAATL